MKALSMRTLITLAALAMMPVPSFPQGVTKRAAPTLYDQAARDSITTLRLNITDLLAADTAILDSIAAHVEQIAAEMESTAAHTALIAAEQDSNTDHRKNLTTLFTESTRAFDSLTAHLSSLTRALDSLTAHRSSLGRAFDSLTAHLAILDRHDDSLAAHKTQLGAHADTLADHADLLKAHADSLTAHRTALTQRADSIAAHLAVLAGMVTRNNDQSDSLAQLYDDVAALTMGDTTAIYNRLNPLVVSVTADTIDWSMLRGRPGWLFIDSIAANQAYVFKNVTAGQTFDMLLTVYPPRFAGVAVTWPASVSGLPTTFAGEDSTYWLRVIARSDTDVVGTRLSVKPVLAVAAAPVDTTTPDAPLIVVIDSTSASATLQWEPVENTPIRNYVVKANTSPIGDTTKLGTGTSYPTITKQDISYSSFTANSSQMIYTLPTPVSPATSIVLPPTCEALPAGGQDRARAFLLMARLSNDGTQVYIEKNTTSYSSILSNVKTSVLTFSKWVSVQHVDTLFGSTVSEVDVTINTVNLSHSFPILQTTQAGENTEYANFWEASFPTTSSVRAKSNGTGASGRHYFQIVSSDSFDVQTISTAFGTSDTSIAEEITSVDTARTMSIVTNRGTTSSSGRLYVGGRLTAPTTYTLKRPQSGASTNVTAYVVTFKAGWPVVVQRPYTALGAADTTKNVTITAANTGRSFTWATSRYGRTAIPTDIGATDSASALTLAISQTDSVTLRLDRANGVVARAYLETATFPLGSGATADTTAWDSVPSANGYYLVDDILNKRYVIQGLSSGVTYHVRAKAFAANGRTSVLSNQVKVSTTLPVNPASGDLYVHFKTGSDDSAGTTLEKALRTLDKALSKAKGGDTILVYDTTTVATSTAYQFTPPVVIKSGGGQRACINLGAARTSAIAINLLPGAKGYFFDSIAVYGGAVWVRSEGTVAYNGASDITFQDCHFENHWGWAGIWPTFCKGWVIRRCTLDPDGYSHEKSHNGDGRDGFYSSNSRDMLVEYSHVTRANHSGFTFEYSTRNSRMRYNTASGCKINFSLNSGSKGVVSEFNVGTRWGLFGFHPHGGSGHHVQGDSIIVRFNVMDKDTSIVSYQCPYHTPPLTVQADAYYLNGYTGSTGSLRWARFYNNTIVNDLRGPATRYSPVFQIANWGQRPIELKSIRVLNNVLVGYDSAVVRWADGDTLKTFAQSIAELQFDGNIVSRWPVGGSTGKALWVTGSTWRTLSYMRSTYPNSVGANNLDANPVFADSGANNWQPAGGSPMVNNGVALTTTSSAKTNSTQLAVVDPLVFSDGQNLPGVQGDLVRCASWTEAVRIVSITGSTLVLEKAMSWTEGESVYYGNDTTPNIGRY